MNTRELGTVLAALRTYQRDLERGLVDVDIATIATNGGSFLAFKPAEIDDLCERLNFGPEQKPKITVSIDREKEKFVVFVPKAIADEIEIDFIDPDDVAPVFYYESHGVEHPCQTHDRLLKDPNYVSHEFD